jgi:nicotinamidase-related amidase
MEALIVVDAQNEFSSDGLRPVPNHADALSAIRRYVEEARDQRRPIAWVRHHNKPTESRAFVPESWGAELSPGLGPAAGHGPERLFVKDVFGAFTTTGLEGWLRELGVSSVLVVGFYTHMCVSTTVREALVRGFEAAVAADATGARELEDGQLGRQSADDVRRSALLHLQNMGAVVIASTVAST